jgi:hypothetical protein
MYISVRPIMLNIKWEWIINIQSTEEKYLGITILDEQFKFQIHFNNQTNKANQRLGMIKRSFTYMDKNMLPHSIKV